jgi:hypothetical protein
MDFAEHEFLRDIFLKLVETDGDPAARVDDAIRAVTTERIELCVRAAGTHRQRLVDMVEEHRRTGRLVVARWWRL